MSGLTPSPAVRDTGEAARAAEPEPKASAYETLFIIGCPRSGTTWIQLLLSQFPEIATAPETQIFAYYLEHFRRQWRHEHESPHRSEQGRAGLSRLLSEAEFEALCRLPARMVLDKIAGSRPAARLVVEKSPKHALMAGFIHRVFPDARFLHIVRDPRDTAASLVAAGRGWGRGWAPRNAIDAARMWNEHVTRAKAVSALDGQYRELRYEDLQSDPAGHLGELLAWLGLHRTPDACRTAVAACELGKLRRSDASGALPIPGEKNPSGFFRKGAVGGWRDDLRTDEVRAIEYLCGPLMSELGYEPTLAPDGKPARVALHDAVVRARESLDWQLQRLANLI